MCIHTNNIISYALHPIRYNICTFFIAFFSATIDDTNLIFGHKLHIGTPYRGKLFWTHQIPTSCLPTWLIFIHIEHICSFFVAFFSGTIDGRNLIFGHKLHIGTPYHGTRFLTLQIPTSCLPKSGGFLFFLFLVLLLLFTYQKYLLKCYLLTLGNVMMKIP